MSKAFKRPLLFPSNGLEYDNVTYIEPITFEYYNILYDSFFNLSSLENLISFVARYSDVSQPHKLYLADFYYLWINIKSVMNTDNDYKKIQICINPDCKFQNTVTIDISEIDIKFLQHGAVYLFYKKDNITIKYRRRKVKDSLAFGLAETDDEDATIKMYNYYIPQIKQIVYKGKEIQRNKYVEFLKSLNSEYLSDIFSGLNINDFGYENEIVFNCKKCKEKNLCSFLSDMDFLFYIPFNVDVKDIESYWSMAFETSRLPIIDYEGFKNLPAHQIDIMTDVVRKIKFIQVA